MKVLSASFDGDGSLIITSDEFDKSQIVTRVFLLKTIIEDLRKIYRGMLKEKKLGTPSKQKAINQRAKERALQAHKYREQGMKYKDIGALMGGISSTRAQQLVQKGKRIIEKEKRWEAGNAV